MTRYSSLSRWNGMHFQEDWQEEDQWRIAILEGKHRDLEWSILVNVATGDIEAKWNRLGGFIMYDRLGRGWIPTGEAAP